MSTTELRQRAVSASATTTSATTISAEEETKAFLREPGSGLSANALVEASPQQHGVVLKLHVPLLYSILPAFLQRFILSWSILSFLAPSWKQRYLILCGSYLYKFKDRSSRIPKGAPFDLEGIQMDMVQLGRDDSIPEIGSLPPGYERIFSVVTLRRRHYYAVADTEEALLWVRSLQEARQAVITRKMGHTNSLPYPQTWTYFDSLGKSLVRTKERIRDRMEESRIREMELTDLSSDMHRGYHG